MYPETHRSFPVIGLPERQALAHPLVGQQLRAAFGRRAAEDLSASHTAGHAAALGGQRAPRWAKGFLGPVSLFLRK